MRPPLQHIPDAVTWHYRLQLNVYRKILQKYYVAQVAGMYVVGCHLDNGINPFVDKVPFMDFEADLLLASQASCARREDDVVGGSEALVTFALACTGKAVLTMPVHDGCEVLRLKQVVALHLQHLPFAIEFIADNSVLPTYGPWAGCGLPQLIGVVLKPTSDKYKISLLRAILKESALDLWRWSFHLVPNFFLHFGSCGQVTTLRGIRESLSPLEWIAVTLRFAKDLE